MNNSLAGTAGLAAFSPSDPRVGASGPTGSDAGEALYNGITLPSMWPPAGLDPHTLAPMPVPYLAQPPEVIVIDVGRQLFVDEFLIRETDLEREFHQPVKYAGNPVFQPETETELNNGYCPCAVPFPDGCWYDPKDRLFKMWYMAGWFDGTALAVSRDGLHWERPELDVVKGTNLVVPSRDNLRRDGGTVWLDHEAEDPAKRFKMILFAREGEIGQPLEEDGGHRLTSGDGIHWNWEGRTALPGDNATFFYNPFRGKWVASVRVYPPVRPDADGRGSPRARAYWESADFNFAAQDFHPVFWARADERDLKRDHYPIGDWPQMYKIDAVGYESLMLNFLQILYGPPNEVCREGGYPKLTEPKVAFSRDGFHLDRRARNAFIQGALTHDAWDRGYVTQVGGGCLVVGDHLFIYYGAFQGDETNRHPLASWNGLYANGATGLCIMRRDGFASMNAGASGGELLTRLVKFSGKHVFVNVDAPDGELRCEVLDRNGHVVAPFTLENCMPLAVDRTLVQVQWRDGSSLAAMAGKPVSFRFRLRSGKLYAFWVAPDASGASMGYVAAGGPGFENGRDTVGSGSYDATSKLGIEMNMKRATR